MVSSIICLSQRYHILCWMHIITPPAHLVVMMVHQCALCLRCVRPCCMDVQYPLLPVSFVECKCVNNFKNMYREENIKFKN